MKLVKQREKPDIAGRLGQVMYWFGCILGILSVPSFLLFAYVEVGSFGFLDLVLGLVWGLTFWLMGRAARYILKGD